MRLKNLSKYFVSGIIILIAYLSVNAYYGEAKPFNILKTVQFYLKNDYVEKNLDDKKLEYGAIKGMLKSLDDPYTRF